MNRSFCRVECNVKKTTSKGAYVTCKRWLGDLDTSIKGVMARFWCRDCKKLHEFTVIQQGIVERKIAPAHAGLEYDPSMVEIS
jgi:hypothetical protein